MSKDAGSGFWQLLFGYAERNISKRSAWLFILATISAWLLSTGLDIVSVSIFAALFFNLDIVRQIWDHWWRRYRAKERLRGEQQRARAANDANSMINRGENLELQFDVPVAGVAEVPTQERKEG